MAFLKARPKKMFPDAGYTISSKHILSPLSQEILEKRNLTIDDAFYPKSRRLTETSLREDTLKAKALLENAKKVGIFSDYDADGVLSAEAAIYAFTKLNIDFEVYIPERAEKYGLSKRGIDVFVEKDCDVLLTADCGSSSLEEVQYAKSKGLKVIVTDHHLYEERPEVDAIINPVTSEFHALSGCTTLCKLLQELDPALEEELLPFSAITTISDVIPLVEENRMILRKFFQNPEFPGLLGPASYGVDRLTLGTIGFQIAPKINAISRMASIYKLPAYREMPVEEASTLLTSLNNERKAAQQKSLDEAQKVLDWKTDVLVVELPEETPVGLLGIVASRLCSKYRKPTLVGVMREDKGKRLFKGSGRAPNGVDLYEILNQSEQYTEQFFHFGGHKVALGFGVDMTSDELRTLVNESFAKHRDEISYKIETYFDLEAAWTSLGEYDLRTSFLELFPFGNCFEPITIRMHGVSNLTFTKPFPKCYYWLAVVDQGEIHISDDELFLIESKQVQYLDFQVVDLLKNGKVVLSALT